MKWDFMTPEQQMDQLKETLWGGPDGEGLVHSVAKLAMAVTELTNAVRLKMDVVRDENGDVINVRSLTQKINKLDKLLQRGLWFLAGIGLMTILILGRSVELVMQGHP